MGAGAGIPMGIFGGLLVLLAVSSLLWLRLFAWTPGGVVLGFGVAGAVVIAVIRALARLANLLGRMENINATGALVSVNGTLAALNSHPELPVRIARVIEPVCLDGGVTPRDRQVALGVMFGELTPAAQHGVVQLCDGVSASAVRMYTTDASVQAGQREHAIRGQDTCGT